FATFAWSLPVLAQNAPQPGGSDSDDLEVPSNPTVPGAAAPKPLPESTPQSSPAPEKSKPVASNADAELQRELAELRARLEAVEHAHESAPIADKPAAPRVTPNADERGSSYLE